MRELPERLNLRLTPDDLLALRIRARLRGTSPTLEAREGGVPPARQLLVELTSDEVIGPLLGKLTQLRAGLRAAEEKAEIAPRTERKAARAAVAKLTEEIDAAEAELVDAAVARARERERTRAEQATVRQRELDARQVPHLQRGITLLEQLAEWSAGFDPLVELGLDRGTAADWRFPFPLLLVEHADRLRRALAPVAAKNGHVCVRLVRFPGELEEGKAARAFRALIEDEGQVLATAEKAALRLWPFNRSEPTWWSEPVAAQLVALGLAERAEPASTP